MRSYTFFMIKSMAVSRGHAFDILNRITTVHGFAINAIQQKKLCVETVARLYKEHVGKPYYENLVESVRKEGYPPIVGIISLDDKFTTAVEKWRKVIGPADGRKAPPSTIRAEFGGHRFFKNAPISDNAVHGSDSEESYLRESRIFF